jgi:hypothetical protein
MNRIDAHSSPSRYHYDSFSRYHDRATEFHFPHFVQQVGEPLRQLSSDYVEEDLARARNLGNSIIVGSGAKP